MRSDGKLDGEFAVQLGAQTASGALRLSAEAAQDARDLAAAAALPAQFGVVEDVSFDGYDGGSVRFESHSFGGAVGGSLIVSGLEVPECLSNPPPIDPNANSSPGCRGIDFVPLWSARWGAP